MKKLDPVIVKETLYIAGWSLVFSMLMQAVFLLIGFWDYTVLLGNILSVSVMILNFFLMCLTIIKMVELEKQGVDAKKYMKVSKTYRFFMIIVVLVLGAVLKCFNLWATIIPVIFPRIAIAFRPLFMKNQAVTGVQIIDNESDDIGEDGEDDKQ